MKHFLLIAVLALIFGCDKKYRCGCSGYEGLVNKKYYKFRADSYQSASITCDSYEEGNSSDGTECSLEE